MSVVFWDGCDDALLGQGNAYPGFPVAVYDYERLVDVFIAQGMDREEAIEWIDFNLACAYLGPGTPIIVQPMTREEIEAQAEGDELEDDELEDAEA